MRVIAGTASGIHLRPPGGPVRPTMDRVRGAVFSSLGERVPGARVLDLFAGAGGYGIEALSRGAAEVLFVDNHPGAKINIEKNLQATRLEGSVLIQEALAFVRKHLLPQTYDLVFADPPYAKTKGIPDYPAALVELEPLRDALLPDGLLVVEKWRHSPAPESPLWTLIKSKRYGASEILYLSPVA